MRRDQRALVNPWQPVRCGEYRTLGDGLWVLLHAVDPDGTCRLFVRGTDGNNRPAALRPGERLDGRDAHLLPAAVQVGAAYPCPAGPAWGWAALKIEEFP